MDNNQKNPKMDDGFWGYENGPYYSGMELRALCELLLFGKIDILDISPCLRISSRSYYIAAYRNARGQRDRDEKVSRLHDILTRDLLRCVDKGLTESLEGLRDGYINNPEWWH